MSITSINVISMFHYLQPSQSNFTVTRGI